MATGDRSARLYRNETATVTAMHEAIVMLETANEEDVVVLTFATTGHRTTGLSATTPTSPVGRRALDTLG